MENIERSFFDWVEAGKAGCMFAQALALNREKSKSWLTYTVDVSEGSAELADYIDDQLTQEVNECEAVTFLFPGFFNEEPLINTINELSKLPAWVVEAVSSGDFPKDVVAVGVRWLQPNYRYASFVLGFADIKTMPKTRRAPCSALMLRPGHVGMAPGLIADKRNKLKDELCLQNGRIPVHLADMTSTKEHPKSIVSVWDGTEALKKKELQKCPYKAVAKAKVSFAFPAKFRSQIQFTNHKK